MPIDSDGMGMRFLLLWLGFAAALSSQALEAGAAKVDITPPLGTPLNGYGERMSRGATGVHDPLTARCIYLSDGETALFLVTTDLCILNRELRTAVLERAPGAVPPENIILTATHNHNGTGGLSPSILWRSISGRYVPDVLAATADKIAEAMQLAYDSRERATIGFGTGKHTGLTVNRRFPDGPIDEQVGVLRVDNADGEPIAILANFAAHPTTIFDDDLYQVSADYPGYFYTELEALAGEGCVALFTNGAEGDQRTTNPSDTPGAWERTEAVGTLLAQRVKEIANDITCDEMTLRLASAQPALPPTIVSEWMPGDVFLQTLEINGDLLMTFFPGEPCVAIGLELRKRALSMGYKAQFSVGLANDHLLYFVPRDYYPEPIYETGMSLYGPAIDEWFYGEFARLMSRAPSPPEPRRPEPPAIDTSAAVPFAVLEGDPYTIGYRRGLLFTDAMTQAFDKYVAEPMKGRLWIPEASGWQSWPPFVDVSAVSLPMLAISVRPGLKAAGDDVFSEVEGMTAAAGLAFDAVWLTQAAQSLEARGDIGDALALPFCTIFTARDAIDAPPLVARTFDWFVDDAPYVFEVRPEGKRAFLQVGFPWSAGVLTGLNDAGVAIAAERIPTLGVPALAGPYIEFAVRAALENAGNRAEAAALLQANAGLRGYAVTIADAAGADVVTFGEVVSLRPMEGATLLNADPANPSLDDATAARYDRAAYLLDDLPEVNAENLAAILSDGRGESDDRAAIFNVHTRFGAVLLPAARTIRMHVPDGQGGLRDGGVFTLAPGAAAAPAVQP